VSIIFIIIPLFVFVAYINFKKTVMPYHKWKGCYYKYAEILNKNLPKKYYITTDWVTDFHLEYLFYRNTNPLIRSTLAAFYLNRKPTLNMNIKYKRDMAVSLSEIMPDRIVGIHSGYSNPSDWLRFIEWLFRCQYDSSHELIMCKKFEVVRLEGTLTYIKLESSMRNVNGIEGLFQELDRQIDGRWKRDRNIFQRWYAKIKYNREYISRTID